MRSERAIEIVLWALALVLLALGTDFRALTADGFRLRDKQDGTVRIVTWNVGGAVEGRPRGYQPDDLWTVTTTLSKLQPDLVFLQEIRDLSHVKEIMSRLGSGWYALMRRGDCAILTSRADVQAVRKIFRVENAVAATLTIGGRSVAVLGLHASAFDAAARNLQIGTAVDVLDGIHGDARILVGDLNLDVDLDKQGALFTNDEQADVETYNYVARSYADAGRGRGTTAEPDRRLDYVFVSSSLEVLDAGPFRDQRRGTMDHDPVVADIRIP